MFNIGKDKEVKTVYQTNDYDKFTFSNKNRDAKLNETLAEEIRSIGQVSPIVVNQYDGTVIDGQHRLIALKELGYPVQYIITQNGASSLPDTNAAQTSWKSDDYLNFYATSGYKHYQDFVEFKNHAQGLITNINFLLAIALRLSTPSVNVKKGSVNYSKKFKEGDFKFTNYEQSIAYLDEFLNFSKSTGLVPKSQIYDAWRMLKNSGADMDHLISAISRNDIDEEIQNKKFSTKTYVEVFCEKYNYKLRKNRLYMMFGSKNEIKKVIIE